jgi:RimJ/RimL family protein N-acetyltransferase
MIEIIEIPVENIEEFWEIQFKYLVEDNIIEPDDYDYFSGNEYRTTIKNHMIKEIDKLHMVYFVKNDIKIGACQFKTYQSEDGKCFILDFWLFDNYRNKGLGHECFKALEKYTKSDGAKYYEINYSNDNNHRFWLRIGFIDNGIDEYNVPLMIKR